MLPVDGPQVDAGLIRSRLLALTAHLRAAAEAADRDPDGFRVVGVTKGHGAHMVQAAVAAGLTSLGENRVQEALPKIATAPPGVEWHLVGHLQSNKARRALEAFDWIHSVDSPALLDRLETIAHDGQRSPRLLLQVNLTGEPSKSGWDPDLLRADLVPGSDLLVAIGRLRHARLAGLMTIGRAGAGTDEARATFGRLRELRDRLADAAGMALPELSMGMTADAEAAVAEGATLVRIGTALFGPRPEAPHGPAPG